MNRLIRRAILASITVVGSKPRTSAAIRTSNADASKLLIVRVPVTPGDEVRPVGREVVADRHDRAEAGDDGTARRILFRHGGSSRTVGHDGARDCSDARASRARSAADGAASVARRSA